MPVLERVFPQGLDAHEPKVHRMMRLAFEEWEESQSNPAIHRAWIKFVLQQTLGLPDEVLPEGQAIPEAIKASPAEHCETLRPDFLVCNPADVNFPGKPRLLIHIYPPDQELDKPVAGRHWKAAPETRMMELLHAADVRLGLVTNGEHWIMVYAPHANYQVPRFVARTSCRHLIATALLTAAQCEKEHREDQSIELVWTVRRLASFQCGVQSRRCSR